MSTSTYITSALFCKILQRRQICGLPSYSWHWYIQTQLITQELKYTKLFFLNGSCVDHIANVVSGHKLMDALAAGSRLERNALLNSWILQECTSPLSSFTPISFLSLILYVRLARSYSICSLPAFWISLVEKVLFDV